MYRASQPMSGLQFPAPTPCQLLGLPTGSPQQLTQLLNYLALTEIHARVVINQFPVTPSIASNVYTPQLMVPSPMQMSHGYTHPMPLHAQYPQYHGHPTCGDLPYSVSANPYPNWPETKWQDTGNMAQGTSTPSSRKGLRATYPYLADKGPGGSTPALLALCNEWFGDDTNTAAKRLFSYYKESWTMQINSRQIRVHAVQDMVDGTGGEIIVMNIDLHFRKSPNEVIYVVAKANDASKSGVTT